MNERERTEMAAMKAENARLRSIVDTRSLIPDLRCDSCDNGVDAMWEFCAWCGTVRNWQHAIPRKAT